MAGGMGGMDGMANFNMNGLIQQLMMMGVPPYFLQSSLPASLLASANSPDVVAVSTQMLYSMVMNGMTVNMIYQQLYMMAMQQAGMAGTSSVQSSSCSPSCPCLHAFGFTLVSSTAAVDVVAHCPSRQKRQSIKRKSHQSSQSLGLCLSTSSDQHQYTSHADAAHSC